MDTEKALNENNFMGNYGGSYSAYYALVEATTGKRVERKVQAIHRNPILVPKNRDWERICSFNPYGMTSTVPTISSTKTTMTVPELLPLLERDGTIVRSDGAIACHKIAIEPVWNLAKLSQRLRVDESHLRKTLNRYFPDPKLLDPKVRVFLPPIEGSTVYCFGDIERYYQEKSETKQSMKVVSRVHDECNGSDTFGSHICSCRPYLVYSIEEAVRYAQNGNLGIVVYNRKEGRALGEVIKFLVYNGRKNQPGGDRAETYFHHTEAFTNVRDARFQQLMPDVLLWLGIRKVDLWMSMSNEKSDALKDLGIEISEQREIPQRMLPKESQIEVVAKIASGYFSETTQ